ncbi:PTS lactose/cellobiose transporter subunit IIA, partial [Clostridioides difficile]|nr:PTS lactose/cellobiose transporter subunit IIA [Clostridioides difficile]
MSTEVQIMELISTAGESKSKAFEALKKVKSKDFKGAKLLIEEARKIDIEAHRIQTELITQDLNEDVESPAMSL